MPKPSQGERIATLEAQIVALKELFTTEIGDIKLILGEFKGMLQGHDQADEVRYRELAKRIESQGEVLENKLQTHKEYVESKYLRKDHFAVGSAVFMFIVGLLAAIAKRQEWFS